MKRVALNLLAFASFAIFVAMFVTWARGGWVDRSAFHHLIGNWEYSSDGGSFEHCVQLIILHESKSQLVGPQLAPDGVFTPACDAWQKQNAPRTHIQSGQFRLDYETPIRVDSQHRLVAGGRLIRLIVPFWAAVAMWGILPVLIWIILPIHRLLARRETKRRAMNPRNVTNEIRIESDQPCTHCGYNLRTLSSAGQCPECGASIRDTLNAIGDLARAPARWLTKLAIANLLLFLSRGSLIATYAASFQRNGGFVGEYVAAVVFSAATIFLYLSGIFLLSTGAHSHSWPDAAAWRLRRLAMISMATLAAGAFYQVISTLTASRPFGLMGNVSVDWNWGPTFLMLAGWILFCWCIVKEFFFLAQLARRIPDGLMANYCKIVRIGLPASSLMLLYMMQDIVNQWSTFSAIEICVLTTWFIFLAWAALLNLVLAIRFKRLGGFRTSNKRLSPIIV